MNKIMEHNFHFEAPPRTTSTSSYSYFQTHGGLQPNFHSYPYELNPFYSSAFHSTGNFENNKSGPLSLDHRYNYPLFNESNQQWPSFPFSEQRHAIENTEGAHNAYMDFIQYNQHPCLNSQINHDYFTNQPLGGFNSLQSEQQATDGYANLANSLYSLKTGNQVPTIENPELEGEISGTNSEKLESVTNYQERRKKAISKGKSQGSEKKSVVWPLWWSRDHDEVLKVLGRAQNVDWVSIANHFELPLIYSKPLKQRFENIKKSNSQKKTRFSHKEDLLIVKLYTEHGTKWDLIAQSLPNRTGIMIKNRFYSNIKKNGLLERLLEELNKEDNVNSSSNLTSPQKDQPEQEKLSETLVKPSSEDIIDENSKGSLQINAGTCLSTDTTARSPSFFPHSFHENIHYDENFKLGESANIANSKLYGDSFDKQRDFENFQSSAVCDEKRVKEEPYVKKIENNLDDMTGEKFLKMDFKSKMEAIKEKLLSVQYLFEDTKQMMSKMQNNYQFS